MQVRKAALIAIIAMAALMLVMPIAPIARAYTAAPKPAQEVPYGPWLDAIEFYEESDEAAMLEKIDKGERHIWLWDIGTVEGIRRAEESPNIEYVKAYSGCFNLFLNPLPRIKIEIPGVGVVERFNPFGIREVREALNLYLDREYVVKEIFAGYGVPHYTIWPPVRPDYNRVYADMKLLENEYAYNPSEAWDRIYKALTDAGCTFKDGKWYDPDGNPIVIKFWIRKTPAQRNALGHYFATELEKLGFEVIRRECTGLEAWMFVYSAIDDWNIYTEGWAFTAISAYDDDLPYYMYCSPWTGTVFEYYNASAELRDLAEKLLMAEYTSTEERNEWVKELARLCLEDSTRIWVVWQITPFPYHKSLTKMVYDITGGFYSLYTLRTARFTEAAGGPVGGTCKAGDRFLYVSAFNPVGGFKWLYDALIERVVYDPGVYVHPHTGRYIPVRATFKVETAGPGGTPIAVPEDALLFDPSALDWYKVGANVTATSAVTFNFIFGKWHHGQDITMADIFAALAHSYRLAYENDTIYDPYSVGPGLETFIATCKGIKVINDTAVTVYIDYWHIDETFIAAQASIWTGTPWELYALMDAAVEAHELAFSDGMSGEWKVPWLDLTKGDSLTILKSHLDDLKAENYIPPYMTDPDLPDCAKITDTDASARWSALDSWYATYGHFLVSNGPFYIETVDTVTPMLRVKAFRDGYPFKADHWDWLITPKIPEISVAMPDMIEIGKEVEVEITSTVFGRPYSDVDISFLMVDAEGNVVLEKTPTWDETTERFRLTISADETSALPLGVYTVYVVALGHEAALARVVVKSVSVVAGIVYMKSLVDELDAKLSAEIEELRSAMDELKTAIEEAKASSAAASTYGTAGIAVGVIGIILGGIASFLARKRP